MGRFCCLVSRLLIRKVRNFELPVWRQGFESVRIHCSLNALTRLQIRFILPISIFAPCLRAYSTPKSYGWLRLWDTPPPLQHLAVMADSFETEPMFKPGKPEILFHRPCIELGTNEGHSWDISPDGKRFLMMKESGTSATGSQRRLNIVLNWFEELKQEVPVK
jgi:hypothetical protein